MIGKSNFKEENVGYMTYSFWIYIYSLIVEIVVIE